MIKGQIKSLLSIPDSIVTLNYEVKSQEGAVINRSAKQRFSELTPALFLGSFVGDL